ncbi:cytochrome c [Comamonas humi]
MKRWLGRLLVAALALLALVAAAVYGLNVRGEAEVAPRSASDAAPSADLVAKGAYIARLGNCMGCHTAVGGPAYAGGRGVETPFGTVFAPNITPDAQHGIGAWSASEFWRALHHGRSRDGRLLYPAFPYPDYTRVAREDADALYAYLQSLPAVSQANRPHQLRFPYGTQAALAVWRALYFRAGEEVAAAPTVLDEGDGPGTTEQLRQRGAYLVHGLGHCAACHTPRNALGGSRDGQPLAGGILGGQAWYAPALNDPSEAGMQHWRPEDIAMLLHAGASQHAGVSGPMAEVVFGSTQYWNATDLRAAAIYLQSLPVAEVARQPAQEPRRQVMELGRSVYAGHCASCHGDAGEGRPPGFPPLAGNRAVLLSHAGNVVQMVLRGGYLPSTLGNPYPLGMPPFQQSLGLEEVAAVSTFIRNSWGNQAPAVDVVLVDQIRERR